jgi:hypothetical protein
MKKFFDKFGNLNGAKFVGIRNYTNKNGETANLSILVNFSTENAKRKDLSTLKSLTVEDLMDITIANELPLETVEIALAELIKSAEKNLTEDDKTVQSIAQADAYIHLTSGVKMHKETMNVFVIGLVNSKTILVHGEYPATNKRIKTKCKDAIKKHCSLTMSKYRQYNVGNMNEIAISGTSIDMSK